MNRRAIFRFLGAFFPAAFASKFADTRPTKAEECADGKLPPEMIARGMIVEGQWGVILRTPTALQDMIGL